mmetsp:Transcript_128651/g.223025  ORF Transcript_128651/g.223025 Transcript_128651/m.223025 type:complete len:941 (-) Transcript_128651:69-2891(-)
MVAQAARFAVGKLLQMSWILLAMLRIVSAVSEQLPSTFPVTVRNFHRTSHANAAGSVPGAQASDCKQRDGCLTMPDEAPQLAMLQTRFQSSIAAHTAEDGEWHPAKGALAGEKPFRFGSSAETEHPPSIGKGGDHPTTQYYEANIAPLTGMVLNIFSKFSNGDGGLLMALEVPALCGKHFVEVDRSRCSGKYPCTLRLPAAAVRVDSRSTPLVFRTRVITEDDDYQTDMLEYDHVTLDYDGEAVVTHQKLNAKLEENGILKRSVKFHLDPVLAAGALAVTPIVRDSNNDTVITMRIRQPDQTSSSNDKKMALTQKAKSGPAVQTSATDGAAAVEASHQKMDELEEEFKVHRRHWTRNWRAPTKTITGCDHSYFEVVADQLFPGDVEVEVWVTGTGEEVLEDVLVTARLNWAEAEVTFLDTILKDHFAFFRDPEEIVHGLPLDALKRENPKQLTDSNPCEWGYALESWMVMVETGSIPLEEAEANITTTLETLQALQKDSDQFAHGLFYPYYRLRDKETGAKLYPKRTDYKELPCGDDALLYASLLLVQGWLKSRDLNRLGDMAGEILGKMDFSRCVRMTDCNAAGNGLEASSNASKADKFWSVALTFNADTLKLNDFNWNVWADEGGLVAMIVALTGAASSEQYESIVRQQQKYSPCANWEGITVGHAAFFNSIFTLPTRSMLGFGTLFESPYYHEFAVRSVLPSFRAHQKLKQKLGVDYIGPSDAMSMMPRAHPGKFFGSYAYWPPNNLYDCREGRVIKENQCTWCKGLQYEGLDDPFDLTVPHGNFAAFLVSSMMERTQFQSWVEDAKKLVTDYSKAYLPGYGMEVMAPAKRTPFGEKFEGPYDGRGIWESLSHGYTILSMYEGLATMSRRYELAKRAGVKVRGYHPPEYRPLSDFVNILPNMRDRINSLLEMTKNQESKEKTCAPSSYSTVSAQDWN